MAWVRQSARLDQDNAQREPQRRATERPSRGRRPRSLLRVGSRSAEAPLVQAAFRTAANQWRACSFLAPIQSSSSSECLGRPCPALRPMADGIGGYGPLAGASDEVGLSCHRGVAEQRHDSELYAGVALEGVSQLQHGQRAAAEIEEVDLRWYVDEAEDLGPRGRDLPADVTAGRLRNLDADGSRKSLRRVRYEHFQSSPIDFAVRIQGHLLMDDVATGEVPGGQPLGQVTAHASDIGSVVEDQVRH